MPPRFFNLLFCKGNPMTKHISPVGVGNVLDWIRNIREFDALEIHPCAVVGRDSEGIEHVEPCTPREAQFWTVYGHYRTGGVDAFDDFPTQAEADAFNDRLIAAYPHLAR
jgi:hypothetical protein